MSLVGYGYLTSFIILSTLLGYYALRSLMAIRGYEELRTQLVIWRYMLVGTGLFALAGIMGGYSAIAGHMEFSADHILHYTFMLLGYICLLIGVYKYHSFIMAFIRGLRATKEG